jgi:hypothetical protein
LPCGARPGPFLLDQWGAGKAFVCTPADCSSRIDVYVFLPRS